MEFMLQDRGEQSPLPPIYTSGAWLTRLLGRRQVLASPAYFTQVPWQGGRNVHGSRGDAAHHFRATVSESVCTETSDLLVHASAILK